MTRRLFLVVENEPPEDRAVEVRCEWCRFWRPAKFRVKGAVCSRLVLTESLLLAEDRLLTGPGFGCSLFEPKETT